MANSYEFIDNGKSITIVKNNESKTLPKNSLDLFLDDNEPNKLIIVSSSSLGGEKYTVITGTDTITGVGSGSTTATELRDALEAIFFLDEAGGGGTLLERVVVTQSNYTTTLGGTIDSTKEYFLDGIIDIGTTQIIVPSGGMYLTGYNFDVSGLTSSEDSYTMFISDVGGSGNILGKDYFIEVTGAASKVYDLTSATGFDAFEFARINYNNCTSLGEINGYRQGLETGTGRFGGSPSFTLSGTWVGGYRITTSIVRALAGTMTDPLFKAGTGFTMASRFLTDINCDLPTLSAFADFSPSNFPNPSTVQIKGAIFTRDGALKPNDTNILSNLSPSDLSCDWKSNNGLPNTYVGGTSSVATEVETVVSAVSTWYDLEGVFITTGAEHFTGNADGELTHDGISPREFEFTAGLTIEGTANNDISIRFMKYDFETTSFTPLDYTITTRQINSLIGGRDVAFFNVVYGGVLDQNDYLKLQVRNNSSSNNLTLETGSYLRIQER